MKKHFSLWILTGFLVTAPAYAFTHSLGAYLGGKAYQGTNLAMGLEYGYMPIPFFSVESFFEKVSITPNTSSFGIGLGIRPVPLFGFKIALIPGLMFSEGTRGLLRIGGGYEFSLGPIFLGPELFVDVMKNDKPFLLSLAGGIQI